MVHRSHFRSVALLVSTSLQTGYLFLDQSFENTVSNLPLVRNIGMCIPDLKALPESNLPYASTTGTDSTLGSRT